MPFFNAKASNEINHSLKFLGDVAEKDVFNINNSEIIIIIKVLKKNFIIFFITT